MRGDIYRELYLINAAFDQVVESLLALHRYRAFRGDRLDRHVALSKETRAVVNSFLTEIITTTETNEAGRRYRERRLREKADEQGD